MDIESWFNTDEIKRFFFPGKIFVGKGTFNQALELCLETEGPVAIIVDKVLSEMPFVRAGLDRLEEKNAGTYLVSGAPIAQEVDRFSDNMSTNPTAVLVIGGGSATDFAKAVVAKMMFGSFDSIGLSGNWPDVKENGKPMLISLPTTAGSGAEASRYYVTYDEVDHHKVFGKSWNLIADWIMLDPVFLETLPVPVLVTCAFDAFVHLFESLICKHERSRVGEMFSLYGIGQIMSALNAAIYHKQRNDDVHGVLMEMATLGGVAISNVRTGNIHEAAGALLERTQLSHPETLFVFFRKALLQYRVEINDREELLIANLKCFAPFSDFGSIEDVIQWWEELFLFTGVTEKIKKEMTSKRNSLDEISEHVFQRVFTDKVWVEKECPRLLDSEAVKEMIHDSFTRFLN